MGNPRCEPTPSQVSGRLATWHRVMEEAGLLYDDLQTPINDPEFRKRLVRFWHGEIVSATVGFGPPQGAALIPWWQDFWVRRYRELFGIELDFAGVRIPGWVPGFNWLVLMAADCPPELLFKEIAPDCRDESDRKERLACIAKRRFPGTYAFWVRDTVEADDKWERGIQTIPAINLGEYLLLRIVYHNSTGGYLDQRVGTVCAGSYVAGSMYSKGYIPWIKYCDRGGYHIMLGCTDAEFVPYWDTGYFRPRRAEETRRVVL